MVLVVTNRDDLTADWLILELRERAVPFARFNTEDYPSETRVTWEPTGAGGLWLSDRQIALRDITSVWFRRPIASKADAGTGEALQEWAEREADEALRGIWRTVQARWVNHPDANGMAGCKPEQLARATRAGFEIPPTLVTNQPTELREFAHRAGPSLICKSLYEGWVPSDSGDREFWTSEFNLDEDDDLQDLVGEPYMFQARIPKLYDIRVTVIGTSVYSVGIGSQEDPASELDWRRGNVDNLDHWVEELPEPLARRCIDLVAEYGLLFGAIDLARRSDGGYTFFELNPNGQWVWLEERTGLPLRSRLVDVLVASR